MRGLEACHGKIRVRREFNEFISKTCPHDLPIPYFGHAFTNNHENRLIPYRVIIK